MGVGGISFGGGFASGLAQALTMKRHEDNQKRENLIQNNYKMLGLMLNSGQFGGIEDVQPFIENNDFGLEKSKGSKAGDPAAHVSSILGHIMRNQNGQPTGRGESQGPLVGSPVLPGSQQVQGATGPDDAGQMEPPTELASTPMQFPQQQPAPRTFMGMPVMSQEQAATRKVGIEGAATEAEIGVRRRMAEKIGLSGQDAMEYALTGKIPTAGRAAAERPMSVPYGNTVLDPNTGKVLYQAPDRPVTPAQTQDRTVTVAPGSRVVNPKTGEVVYTAPDRPKDAAGGGAASDDADLAEMAAGNPSVLQGLTPTVAGSVMRAIAKNPALKARFEQVRMQPLRDQATAAISALDQLVDVDDKGNVTGLKPGTAGLYGAGIGRLARFVPGSDTATAKAALDQVTGQLTLQLIQDMKAQSRTGATGFGQLSARELEVLQSGATTLKGEISEARALRELKKLRERFSKILQPGQADTAAASPTKARKDANGNWILSVP